MKKNVIDGKNWIYNLLYGSSVKGAISGKIYKDKRPLGSQLEDIVINSLTMTNEYLQEGVFNINLYVPMRSITIGGVVQLEKNNARIKTLVDVIYPVLNEAWGTDYNIEVVNTQDFEEENENFYNFRVNLFAHPNI